VLLWCAFALSPLGLHCFARFNPYLGIDGFNFQCADANGTFMSDDNDLTTLRLRIEGFVQAVGYRHFAIEEAKKLGLDGWIRNRSDGTVEAVISGPTKPVELFVQACMRGPAGSRVANVELGPAEPPEEKGFRRRPSL
jgi:acylphosphatase